MCFIEFRGFLVTNDWMVEYGVIAHTMMVVYPNQSISVSAILQSNTRGNYTMRSVQQEHQTGAHSRYEGVTDDTWDYIGN